MDASFLLYAVGRVLPRVAAGARCPRCLQAWITMPLPSSFKSHCLSQVRICFSLRDLLFNPTIRRLSTLHLQPHKLSPKRWSTCALGAEILPRSQWIGITSTAVVGEPPLPRRGSYSACAPPWQGQGFHGTGRLQESKVRKNGEPASSLSKTKSLHVSLCYGLRSTTCVLLTPSHPEVERLRPLAPPPTTVALLFL